MPAASSMSSGIGTSGIGGVEQRDEHAGQRDVGADRQVDALGQDHRHLAERHHDEDGGVVEQADEVARAARSPA